MGLRVGAEGCTCISGACTGQGLRPRPGDGQHECRGGCKVLNFELPPQMPNTDVGVGYNISGYGQKVS